MRCLRAAGHQPRRGQDRTGGSSEQPQPPWLRGDRRRQSRPRTELSSHRLLRRHPRLRGARQHHPVRQRRIFCPRRPPRRQHLSRGGRQQQPAPTHLHRAAAHRPVQEQDPHRRGDGPPLRRPHRRAILLLLLRRPHLERQHSHSGCRAEPVIRGAVAGAVPVEHIAGDGADRPGLAQRAGQQLLQAAAARHGALLLRQPAAGRREPQRAGEPLRGERDLVEGALRGGHGEDGPHPGADRELRPGTAQLQRRQPDLIVGRPGGLRRRGGPRRHELAETDAHTWWTDRGCSPSFSSDLLIISFLTHRRLCQRACVRFCFVLLRTTCSMCQVCFLALNSSMKPAMLLSFFVNGINKYDSISTKKSLFSPQSR